jgi:RNA polymerase sigma factor (sigma-70 family)
VDTDFTHVFDEHVWSVYGFFAYRVGSRDDAEDLTQTTFERALSAWGRFDPKRSQPRTWLMAIAHNQLVDHYRRDRSRSQIALGQPGARDDEMPSIGGPEESLGLSPELARALGRLGDRERELLALRFGGDLTGPEIAATLGLTLANVQQILSRALRRLRAELDEPLAVASGAERADAGQADRGHEQQQRA